MCCVILTLTYFRVEPPESIWTPCNLLVLILILSECKQAELSADFLSDFANFMSVLYFSACARPSGILYYIFLLVERDLVFCVIYFPDFLFILCCIISTLLSFQKIISSCLKLSLMYALFTCGILCYIFLRLKRAWYFETFGYIFSACVVFVMYACYYKRQKNPLKNKKIFVVFFRGWNDIWYFVLYDSACGTHFGILCYMFPRVECALVFCVIYFRMWNVLWYFLLYFLHVERSLVFFLLFLCVWNAFWYCVLYIIACGTRSVFCAVFFHVWNTLWYCGFTCYIFPRVERSLVFCVIYFLAFLFILCWIIPTLISPKSFFSARLKLNFIYALW